ncbi:MAG: hypothetical protein Q4E65_02070 [Clostridia bacterium]|nr:hypothetical protein [Clostridia bacterium]
MRYYKLTNFVYRYFFLQNILLCAGLFFTTLVLLSGFAVGNTNNALHALLPYESIIYRSGMPYVFAGALCLQALLTTLRCMVDFGRTGGASILLLLPGSRRVMILAFVTAGMLGALMLYAAQTLGLLAAYPSILCSCQDAVDASKSLQLHAPVARTNGLFLAMLRSDLFHILLPQSSLETLHTLLLLLAFGGAPAIVLFSSDQPDKPLSGAILAISTIALATYLLCLRGALLVSDADADVSRLIVKSAWLLWPLASVCSAIGKRTSKKGGTK